MATERDIARPRLIAPVDASWDTFFDGPSVSSDFVTDRIQPDMRKREAL
jgi:antitoxin VapB